MQIAAVPGWAQRQSDLKAKSRKLAALLAIYAQSQNETGAQAAYRNTWAICRSWKTQLPDGTVHNNYTCKRRHCLACMYARTVEKVAFYGAYLESWGKSFGTFTTRNIPADRHALIAWHKQRARIWRLINDDVRRRFGSTERLIWALEVPPGQDGTTIHPHIHAVGESRELMQYRLERWCHYWAELADAAAQLEKPTVGGAAVELLKYMLKVDRTDAESIPVLHEIFQGMKGKNSYGIVGFRKADVEEFNALWGIDGNDYLDQAQRDGRDDNAHAFKRLGEGLIWNWEDTAGTWMDYGSGELLTDPAPVEGLPALAESLRHFELQQATPRAPCTLETVNSWKVEKRITRVANFDPVREGEWIWTGNSGRTALLKDIAHFCVATGTPRDMIELSGDRIWAA